MTPADKPELVAGYYRCTESRTKLFTVGTAYEVYRYEPDGRATVITNLDTDVTLPHPEATLEPHDPWGRPTKPARLTSDLAERTERERVAAAIEICFVERTQHHPIAKHLPLMKWIWPKLADAAIAAQRPADSGLVEEVARNQRDISVAGYEDPTPWDDLPEPLRNLYRHRARAAISTIFAALNDDNHLFG